MEYLVATPGNEVEEPYNFHFEKLKAPPPIRKGNMVRLNQFGVACPGHLLPTGIRRTPPGKGENHEKIGIDVSGPVSGLHDGNGSGH